MIALANKSDCGRIFLFFKNRDFDLSLEKCTVRAWIIERLALSMVRVSISFTSFTFCGDIYGRCCIQKIINDDF